MVCLVYVFVEYGNVYLYGGLTKLKGVWYDFGMANNNKETLSPAQELFLSEYFKTNNARRAYLTAFPDKKRWKIEAVDSAAWKLLNTEKVLKRIAEYKKKLEMTGVLNKQKILQELVRQYEEASKNGTAERTNSVQVLKILAQITKLLGGDNVTVNVQNNVAVGQVADYLDL